MFDYASTSWVFFHRTHLFEPAEKPKDERRFSQQFNMREGWTLIWSNPVSRLPRHANMAIPRLDAHNMASRRAINRRVWTFERNEARHVQALPTWPRHQKQVLDCQRCEAACLGHWNMKIQHFHGQNNVSQAMKSCFQPWVISGWLVLYYAKQLKHSTWRCGAMAMST